MHDYFDPYDDRRYYGQPPPDPWRDEAFDRYATDRSNAAQSRTMNCLIGTVVGSAAGVLLSLVPWFGLARHQAELIKIGAAAGGLVGMCQDTPDRPESYD